MAIIKPVSGLRSVRYALWALVALVVGGFAIYTIEQDRGGEAGPQSDYASAFGGSFRLVDQSGRPVTDQTLLGKPFAIFFGFTRCAEVCPTTLQSMALLRKKLGTDGDKLNLVFVSLDPEHDKPADIGQYLTLFGTPIIGLTGSPAELERIVKGYHVYYKKVPIDGGDYVIDHTATVFLMDRQGKFSGTLSHDEGEAPRLEKLRRLVRT
ncbi:electron transporter SenC [Sphingomonas sp. Root710]|uniref:SCO family protein n=1 Tax=Sphingomonas sp. Root710 TaxID=1736594 RepID=UPI0006F8BE55|nr:SCO family protein [Sphingomonas sp. Root710]KRB85588.1 electron transporter SenC [Sphingomonas sp. Root710]